MVFSAWVSVVYPMTALITTTPAMTMASAMPPVAMDIPAETANRATGGLMNCSSSRANLERGLATLRAFGPYSDKRANATLTGSPSGELARRCTTCSSVCRCQSPLGAVAVVVGSGFLARAHRSFGGRETCVLSLPTIAAFRPRFGVRPWLA